MISEIDMRIFKTIVELMYEPKLHEGSPKVGDYGGFDINRRIIIVMPSSNDSRISGYELFTTKVNEEEYVGLYRTWYNDYGGMDGGVVSMLNLEISDEDYPAQRLFEVELLFGWIKTLISQFEKEG